MTEFVTGARADNPLHKFAYPEVDDLWWRADAWNEDTIEWLGRKDDIARFEDTIEAVELEICGFYAPAIMPQMAMTPEQLTDFYLLVGDGVVVDGNVSYIPSTFVYDPSSPLSRPVQLVSHYVELQKALGGMQYQWSDPTDARSAAEAILQITPLTVEEWDWLYDVGLAGEDFNADGNVIDFFAASPGLHLLPARPALGNKSPVDYMHDLILDRLDAIKARFDGGEVDAILGTNTTSNAFANVERWIVGLNPQAHHLAELQAKLEDMAVTFAKVIPPANGVVQLVATNVIGNLVMTMVGVSQHPNFTSEMDTPGMDDLLARGDDDTRARIFEDSYVPYLTLDRNSLDPVTPQEIGLFSFQGGRAGYRKVESIQKVGALLTYSPEQGEEAFRLMVLGGYRPTWSMAVTFAPMFGRFFRELREQYGDYTRSIPLQWILEASSESSVVDC